MADPRVHLAAAANYKPRMCTRNCNQSRRRLFTPRARVVLLVLLVLPLLSQRPAPWQDPSPHRTRFVTVGDNVRVEALDWGGSGRPLVLLAGGGDTAHVFDDFAPKLASDFHVYGITRRGFGESGFAPVTSGADTFGDDVLAVFDALRSEERRVGKG